MLATERRGRSYVVRGFRSTTRRRRQWKEAGLTQPWKRKRRRRTGESVPVKATCMNHVWTYDFIHDRTVGGKPVSQFSVNQ